MAQDYNFVDIKGNVVLQGKMPMSEFNPKSVKTSPTTYGKISNLGYTKVIEGVAAEAADSVVEYLNIPNQLNVKGEDGKPIMLTPEMIKKFVSNSLAKTLNGKISENLELAGQPIVDAAEDPVQEETVEEVQDEEIPPVSEEVNNEEFSVEAPVEEAAVDVEPTEEDNDEEITFNFEGIDIPEEKSEEEAVEEVQETEQTAVVDENPHIYNSQDGDINQSIKVLTSFKELMNNYANAKETKRKEQEALISQLSDVEKEIDEIRQNEQTAIENCRVAYNAVKSTLDQLNIDPAAQFGIDLDAIGISTKVAETVVEDNGYKK